MSRIGKLPIPVPAGVEVKIDGQSVEVKGPKGTLSLVVAEPIAVALEESTVVVSRPNDERLARSLHGLTRTLIANNIQGVTEGFTKGLEIVGTGYRVAAKGNALEFALGYSHPITVEPPAGISFLLFTASTSRPWAKSPPTFASYASQSLTRARVFVTLARLCVARPESQVSKHGTNFKDSR